MTRVTEKKASRRPSSKTRPSTQPPSERPPRLTEYARSFVFPASITRTIWPRIVAKGDELGLRFDWWQDSLGQVCFGYDESGKYAATVGGIGLSIPRQVGKTYFVLACMFIMCILFPGYQVVWTSHHLRTTTKTLTTAKSFARRKRIAPFIRTVRTANGEGQVEFVNGSVIMFGARSQGFGRGFDEIDAEVFDEAQIMDTRALEDMIAATNQARHEFGALLFFMGTPPRPIDKSGPWLLRRAEALAGTSTDSVWLEIGADPDSDPDDRSLFPLFNPSYPHRTPLESMLRLRKNLGDDDSWNREGRGIYDSASKGVIPSESWTVQADPNSSAVDRLAVGVEVGPDLQWASISVAGQRADGSWHVALAHDRHTEGKGVEWLWPRLDALLQVPNVRAVVVDVSSPIKTMVEQRGKRYWLKRPDGTRGIEVHALTVNELGIGCTSLLSGVVTGEVWHIGQPQLTSAALAAGKRALGDTGMWVWNRRSAMSDITPIQAATYALIGAQLDKPRGPGVSRSGRGGRSSSGRRAVVIA